MTMTNKSRAREWKLYEDDDGDLQRGRWSECDDKITHVIEYSAYLAIQQELDEAVKLLRSCNECWDHGSRKPHSVSEYLAKYPKESK